MSLFNDIYNVVMRKRNPVKYWKKKGATIGDNCDINSSVKIISEPYLVSLGNHVRMSAGVQLITHDGGVWVCRNINSEFSIADIFGRIKIGDNVHIGTNAIIMPNVSIGSNVIIGCGAIVTKDIPDNSVAVGVPARVIGNIENYIQKHKGDFVYTKGMKYSEKREYIQKQGVSGEQTE